MTKSRLFIIFVLLLAALTLYLVVELTREPDLLDLVPGDSYAVLELQTSFDTISFFQDSPLGKSLIDLDREEMYRVFGFSQSRQELIDKRLALAAGIISNRFFEIIFSNRIVIALLPEVGGDLATTFAFSENLVLLTRVHQDFLAAVNDLEKQSFLKPLMHNGVAVQRVLLPGGKIIYFSIDRGKDTVIISLNPNHLKRCLDLSFVRMPGRNHAITANPAYMSLQRKAGGKEDLFFFINNGGVSLFSRCQFFPGFNDDNSMARLLLSGFESGGFFYQTKRATHKFTSILNFDPAVADSVLPTGFRRPPIKNRLIDRTPSDTQLYVWSNWLDIHGWWMAGQNRVKTGNWKWGKWLISFIQENSGLEIDVFLDIYGDQLEVAVKEIKSSVFLPVPVMYLSVEILDRNQIEKFLDSALAPVATDQVKINDFPVVSLSLAGGLMKPAYGLIDNFVVFADHKELIEEMLTAENKLIGSPDFLALGIDLTQDKNLIFFARSEQLNKGLKDILLWLKEHGNGTGQWWGKENVVDYVAMPVLDAFSLFTAGSLWLSMGEKDMITELSLLVREEEDIHSNPSHLYENILRGDERVMPE